MPLATSTVPPPVDTQPAIVPTDGDDGDDEQDDDSGNSGNGNSGNGNSGSGNSGNGNGNSGNGNGNSGNGNSGTGNGGNAPLLSATGAGATSLDIAPSDWQGAFTDLDVARYGQDCVALYGVGSGTSEATYTFTLDSVPSGGLLLSLSGLDDEMSEASVLQISVNGLALNPGNAVPFTFGQWDGQDAPPFTRLTLQLPPESFASGQNSITLSITGQYVEGSPFPFVLLGAGTLAIADQPANRDVVLV